MSDEAVLEAGHAPERKSLDTPLLIGALVLIAAMAAWFFLGSDDQVIESAPIVDAEPVPEAAEIEAVVATEVPNSELLSRARLAADAGMLTEPAGSNALYYYAQFVEQAPDTAVVQQELDAVLARVGSLADAAVASGDWQRAAFIVEQLNNAGFDHPSVGRFERALAEFRAAQSDAALAAADAGDEARANAVLETLAALPRTQTSELLALRADVRDRLDARRIAAQAAAERAAAEQARQQRAAAERREAAQAAAAERPATTPAPAATAPTPAPTPAPAEPVGAAAVAAVRDALAAGRLRGSDGAAGLLAEVPADAPDLASLRADVLAALARGIEQAAAAADPGTADRLFREYDRLATDGAEKARLSAAVDQSFIARATAETVSAATLRRTKAVAPVYPRRALQRNLTGRVKVEFTVGTDGRTREIEVVESNQGSMFDRSALRAISEWEYEPRVVRGQPVAQRVYAYLDYNLE